MYQKYLVTFILLLPVFSSGLYFHIGETERKCFIEEIPDETMVNLISSELKNLGDEPWLLDGFPRTIAQAEALQKETPVNVVINLDVPFDTIIDRVKGKKYYSHTYTY